MNSRTLIMMTLMLGANWGGFIFLLWYGAKRANKQ
jgi:arginine exporter protein ArgO